MSYSSSTIVKQGYLTKKGAKRKNWTKRWFILKKDKLEYFKNPGDSQPKGVILLEGVSIESSDKKPNCFSLKNPDSERVYYIQCNNATLRTEWINSIEGCLNSS